MTRPRPRNSPVMTGAVDLAGLKKRAQQGSAGGVAGVEITEANLEAEVLVRSGEVPVVVLLWSPRSDVCIALADDLGALAAADNGIWSLATVNVDAAPRVAAM
ncbi:MAG: co-chaperone YbbN, partial [Mycobacteriaceae bacterium]